MLCLVGLYNGASVYKFVVARVFVSISLNDSIRLTEDNCRMEKNYVNKKLSTFLQKLYQNFIKTLFPPQH